MCQIHIFTRFQILPESFNNLIQISDYRISGTIRSGIAVDWDFSSLVFHWSRITVVWYCSGLRMPRLGIAVV